MCVCLWCVYVRNLRNLEIALRILGIPKLRANLEIAQWQDCAISKFLTNPRCFTQNLNQEPQISAMGLFRSLWIIFWPFWRAMVLLVWQPFSPNRSEQNLSKTSHCWSIDDITHSSRSHYVTSGAGDRLYKWFPSRECTSPIHMAKVKSSKIAQYVCTISRLCKRIAQSQDCLRNLKIGTQFRDSENALHNLEITQISKLRGTCICGQWMRVQRRLESITRFTPGIGYLLLPFVGYMYIPFIIHLLFNNVQQSMGKPGMQAQVIKSVFCTVGHVKNVY